MSQRNAGYEPNIIILRMFFAGKRATRILDAWNWNYIPRRNWIGAVTQELLLCISLVTIYFLRIHVDRLALFQ
jgi:hypothetical protein